MCGVLTNVDGMFLLKVVAQASRSLARQAIEDKEYVARLLNQAQTEVQLGSCLVDPTMCCRSLMPISSSRSCCLLNAYCLREIR